VTGDITRLFVDGSATVKIDGQVIDPADYDPHGIEIIGDGSYAEYEFTVSDEVISGEALQSSDGFSGATASGSVSSASDFYRFDGQLTNLTVDGSATVEVDGQVVDPNTVG
jgi:hypothetical protein